MSRPIGSVGRHRHRAELIFAQHGKDPLEEALKLADDPALSTERRAQLWLALVPFLYPKLRSILIEDSAITADDVFNMSQETYQEVLRRCNELIERDRRNPTKPIPKGLPLPTCRADLKRYK